MDTAGLNLGVWIDGWVASGSHAIHPRRPSKYRLSPDCASLKTFSQHLAPAVCSIQSPNTSLHPSARIPNARIHGLIFHAPFIPNLKPQRIETQWDTSPQAGASALRHFRPHFIGDRRNQIGLAFPFIQFQSMPRISRTLIPRAYRRITCASEPGKRRCDISQYARAQKWKAGRVESPGAHHPQAGSRSSRCCRCGDYPSVLAHSVEQDDDSVQPPASAPPTVSSVNPKARIRLTATLHLCSVLERAMGLSVHLKIFCLDIFVRCVLLHFDHEHSFFESSSHDLDMQNS